MVIMVSGIARGHMHDDDGGDNDNGVMQDDGHTSANRLTDMHPWFIASVFDSGHPCYSQLTPVKTRFPLTSITLPYCGLKFRAH